MAYRTPTSEEMDEAAGYFLSEGFRINYPDAKKLCTLAELPQIKVAVSQVSKLERLAGKTAYVAAVAQLLQKSAITTQDDLTSATADNRSAEKGLGSGLEETQNTANEILGEK
jgi:hypothetical protein